MIPGNYDITIFKGISFYNQIVWTDNATTPVAINITGWTPQCDVRRSPSRDVVFSITCAIPTGTDGATNLTMTKTQTDALTAGTYKYDLVFTNTSSERVGPLISGKVTVVELNSQL